MSKPRLRDLGIAIGTMPPGEWNAITDVPGVRVGHTTVLERESVRTGVTAIHPHEGSAFRESVPAAVVVLNGSGELTGRSQIDEYGILESPILITNTLSVGTVHRATVDWLAAAEPMLGSEYFVVPVVAETFDGFLNDTAGQHVTIQHTLDALNTAAGGPVSEGAVGGGTGMLTCEFKGGIGTSSRLVELDGVQYAVGVLVQSNFGRREDLIIDGVPVGRHIQDHLIRRPARPPAKDGSIIIIVATDAPLSDRQLRRLGQRATLGLSRAGGIGRNSSGDIVLAFSNAKPNRVIRSIRVPDGGVVLHREQIDDRAIDPFFQAVVESTSEAIANALVASESMTGRDGNFAMALPHDRLIEIMRQHGRLG